jgi:glycosyltransferase involved in cell wall biosynthesis
VKNISVLIPVFNEEKGLPFLLKALETEVGKYKDTHRFTYLLINDGCRDRSQEVIEDLGLQYSNLNWVVLSRNFGKEVALLAGFDFLTTDVDAVIIMDADLQHDPSYFGLMLQKYEEGYDDVYGIRTDRKEQGYLRRLFSSLFYRLLKALGASESTQNAGDFRLMSRPAFEAIRQNREKNRYTKGLYTSIGFSKTHFYYECADRIEGKSTFNFLKLMELAIDGITSFSVKPLRLATLLGLLGAALAMIYFLVIIFNTIVYGEPVQGFPTIASLILVIGSANLIGLGILGEYVGKIYIETKNRPNYYVKSAFLGRKKREE